MNLMRFCPTTTLAHLFAAISALRATAIIGRLLGDLKGFP
jgi:hypothetical protein